VDHICVCGPKCKSPVLALEAVPEGRMAGIVALLRFLLIDMTNFVMPELSLKTVLKDISAMTSLQELAKSAKTALFLKPKLYKYLISLLMLI
jgi:hypothetical protein